MTSKKFCRATLALIALAAVGCRDMNTDMDTGTNPVDAGRDTGGGTDVMGMDTTGMDVPVGTDTVTPTDSGVVTVTIRQLQDIADPAHPAPGSHVTLNEPNLVALTSRVLIGSATGGTSGICRFGVWIGSGQTGDFSGILLQELIDVGDASDCFDVPEGIIPARIRAGSPISVLSDVTYSEFCGGATGTEPSMCRNWEQSRLTIRRSATTMTVGTAVNAPSPTLATVPELGTANATMPGSRSINLEGAFVQVSNGRVVMQMNDAGFTEFYLADNAGSTNMVQILTRNSFSATCIRNYLTSQNGMNLPSVTGALSPEFGLWSIRVSGPDNIGGLNCTMDGGTGTDAGD